MEQDKEETTTARIYFFFKPSPDIDASSLYTKKKPWKSMILFFSLGKATCVLFLDELASFSFRERELSRNRAFSFFLLSFWTLTLLCSVQIFSSKYLINVCSSYKKVMTFSPSTLQVYRWNLTTVVLVINMSQRRTKCL